ncbi:MAG TPA: tyrosine-type recombinase/integrase [Chthoniobacterales bacterium]|nr:tyrosine-type recombinase/integrase [Chthoniobacterales bacterium]
MKVNRLRFPIEIKQGSSRVKIYRDRKASGTYYRVVYYIGGKRERLTFSTLERAIDEAEAQAKKLSRGDIDALQITGKDRLVYSRALEAVREHGVTLDGAALEYSEARKMLNGVSLVDAAKFYARHHGQGIVRKRVSEAIDEMIAAKRESGVSDLYLSDLRYRLRVFSNSFGCDVNQLGPDDVAGFFSKLNLSARSYNNFRRTLKTFFSFAQKKRWLSKETDLLEPVEKRKEKSAAVEIFTPAEVAELFEYASTELAPCIALGAFAGLRAEEILRLEWADVDRRPGFIEVGAHKAKTATRRLVPIADNLAQWLAVSPRGGSHVWPHSKPYLFESIRKSVAEVSKNRKKNKQPAFVWKTNVLRHSWISYRLADVQDINRVALEAGNSPQMIFRHYRELATPEQACTWFSIAPPATEKVTAVSFRRK